MPPMVRPSQPKNPSSCVLVDDDAVPPGWSLPVPFPFPEGGVAPDAAFAVPLAVLDAADAFDVVVTVEAVFLSVVPVVPNAVLVPNCVSNAVRSMLVADTWLAESVVTVVE